MEYTIHEYLVTNWNLNREHKYSSEHNIKKYNTYNETKRAAYLAQ